MRRCKSSGGVVTLSFALSKTGPRRRRETGAFAGRRSLILPLQSTLMFALSPFSKCAKSERGYPTALETIAREGSSADDARG